jgi:hypothetical protein
MLNRNRGHVQRAAAAVVGLASLGVVSTIPVSAQSACQDGSNVLVEFLGAGTSNTIMFEQTDGFQGDVRVKVYCGADNTPVPNATVTLSTTVPNSFVIVPGGAPQPATSPATAIVSVPTGDTLVTLKSSDPDLTGWKAKVGTNTIVVTGAYGTSLAENDYPTATGQLYAQTPELSSLALFGSGALGMAGYGLTRLRAMRRRKD